MRFVALAIAFFGAIGIGLVVGRPATPTDPSPSISDVPSAPSGDPAVARSADPPIAPERDAPERDAPESSDETLQPASETESLADVIAALPVGTWEGGDGAIDGVVRDAKGKALHDFEVRAVIWGTTPGVDQPPPHEVSLAQYIATEVEQFHYDHAMIKSVRTDVDGRFEFTGLRSEAQYHLHLVAPGWFGWGANKNRISPGESCELTAYRTTPVDLRVRRTDGTPVLGGRVWVGDSSNGRRYDRYAYLGNWSHGQPPMPMPTEFSLLSFVSVEGDRSGFVSAEFVPGTPAVLEVELPALPKIHCTVNAPPGADLGGWFVGLQPVHPDLDPSSSRSYQRERIEGHSCWLTLREPGPVRVGLMFDGQVVEQIEVDALTGVTPVSFSIPAPNRARMIEVRVVDAKGKPVDSVEIHSTVTRPQGGWVDTWTTRDADGSYRVGFRGAFDPDSEFNVEQVQLTCQSPQHGSQSVLVDMNDAPRAEVVFEEPAWLVVDTTTVRNPDLLNRLALSLVSGQGEEVRYMSTEDALVGGQTQVRLGPIAPGPCTLSASLMTDRWSRLDYARFPLTIEAGEQEWKLALPEAHELLVHVSPGVAPDDEGASVSLYRLPSGEPGELQIHTNSTARVIDGIALFPFLPGGEYRVAAGGEHMEVSVHGDQRIDFEPVVYDCAEIEITNPSGQLATWGFRTGDKIIAVDGEGVDPPYFRVLRFAFAVTGTRPITILRGGRQLDITITVGEDPTWDLGGEIEPAQR